MAQELTGRADEESTNGGKELIAAEFFWGAFAHCLIGIALNQGLPHDSHGAFEGIARHFDAAQGSNRWRSLFGVAEGYTCTSTTVTCRTPSCEPTNRPPHK